MRQGRGTVSLCLRPAASCVGMINYTERIALLMQDIVRRTPSLSFIDLSEVLVFARFGRSEAEGAFATCHCLTLPESEPGYFFWRDRVDRRADAPIGVVRHQVSRRAARRHVDQVSDLVRAAALLRSGARAVAQGRALSGCAQLDRQARHHRPRALSHRSGRVRHPPLRARRRQRLDALARAAVLRAGRDDGARRTWRRTPIRRCTSSSRTTSPR